MIFIYVHVHMCQYMRQVPTESRRGHQILCRSQPAQVSAGNQAGSGEEHQAFLTAEPSLLGLSSSSLPPPYIYLFIYSFILSLAVCACMHIHISIYRSEDGFHESFLFSPMKVPGIERMSSDLAGLNCLSGPMIVLLSVNTYWFLAIAMYCFIIDSAHFIFLRTAVTESVV